MSDNIVHYNMQQVFEELQMIHNASADVRI